MTSTYNLVLTSSSSKGLPVEENNSAEKQLPANEYCQFLQLYNRLYVPGGGRQPLGGMSGGNYPSSWTRGLSFMQR